jgi:hypothetical protein
MSLRLGADPLVFLAHRPCTPGPPGIRRARALRSVQGRGHLAYGAVARSTRICRRKRVRIDRSPSRAHRAAAPAGAKRKMLAAQPQRLQGSTPYTMS